MSVYVDTSGFYAFLCRDDRDHGAVTSVMRRLAKDRDTLMTTSYVVCETMGLVQRRLGLSVLRAFVEDVMPLVEVVWIGREEHDAAWGLMLGKPRRALTVVDAAGIVVMQREGIRRCIALDPEFGRAGFEVLPGGAS